MGLGPGEELDPVAYTHRKGLYWWWALSGKDRGPLARCRHLVYPLKGVWWDWNCAFLYTLTHGEEALLWSGPLFIWPTCRRDTLKKFLMHCIKDFLSMPASVAFGERSFSKLKLVNKFLRTTTVQERLYYLARVSIETDLTRRCNFNEIIFSFAKQKARRYMCWDTWVWDEKISTSYDFVLYSPDITNVLVQ